MTVYCRKILRRPLTVRVNATPAPVPARTFDTGCGLKKKNGFQGRKKHCRRSFTTLMRSINYLMFTKLSTANASWCFLASVLWTLALRPSIRCDTVPGDSCTPKTMWSQRRDALDIPYDIKKWFALRNGRARPGSLVWLHPGASSYYDFHNNNKH